MKIKKNFMKVLGAPVYPQNNHFGTNPLPITVSSVYLIIVPELYHNGHFAFVLPLTPLRNHFQCR